MTWRQLKQRILSSEDLSADVCQRFNLRAKGMRGGAYVSKDSVMFVLHGGGKWYDKLPDYALIYSKGRDEHKKALEEAIKDTDRTSKQLFIRKWGGKNSPQQSSKTTKRSWFV